MFSSAYRYAATRPISLLNCGFSWRFCSGPHVARATETRFFSCHRRAIRINSFTYNLPFARGALRSAASNNVSAGCHIFGRGPVRLRRLMQTIRELRRRCELRSDAGECINIPRREVQQRIAVNPIMAPDTTRPLEPLGVLCLAAQEPEGLREQSRMRAKAPRCV